MTDIYNNYAIQTGKQHRLMIDENEYNNYILAKIPRERLILDSRGLDKLLAAAAENVAQTAIDLIKSVSI